jgi:cobalt-zinc-cadmium efflux system membrane fusion protein
MTETTRGADSRDESSQGTAVSLAPARKRSLRWLAVALPAAALAGALVFWLLEGKGASAPPAPSTASTRVEGSSIRYTKAFAERAGLKLARAESAVLVPVINAVGTVDFDPQHVAAVGARLRGLVTRVHKFEGDKVEAGAVLAIIESAELSEAQAAVNTLEAEKRAAEVNLARETALAEKKLSTAREQEMASVEARRYTDLLAAARQKVAAMVGNGSRAGRLGAHELKSPIAGTVVERSVAPGQTIDGELVAFRVANTEHLWVELDVFEKNLALVQVDDRVEVSPLSTPAQTFEGRVARIGAVIDSETRSAPVRVEVGNPLSALRAGQAVNARIHASGGGPRKGTLVPTSAVTFVDGKPTVFVGKGPGAVDVASVEVGFSNGTQTEILSGVAPHAEIVSEGVFALKSELFR